METLRERTTVAVASLGLMSLTTCGGPVHTDASHPEQDPQAHECRVWVEARFGEPPQAIVRGSESTVEGGLGATSTAVLRGPQVVIEGWMEDIEPGRLSGDGFTVTVYGKDHPSDPIIDGRTSIAFKGALGEDRLDFGSANCSPHQIGFGATHLTALLVQQRHNRAYAGAFGGRGQPGRGARGRRGGRE